MGLISKDGSDPLLHKSLEESARNGKILVAVQLEMPGEEHAWKFSAMITCHAW